MNEIVGGILVAAALLFVLAMAFSALASVALAIHMIRSIHKDKEEKDEVQ